MHWPSFSLTAASDPTTAQYARIYDVVKSTGVPNHIRSRLVLPTSLNIQAWEKYLAHRDPLLLDMIKFGFPLGYLGPVSDTVTIDNHPSATNYADKVADCIKNEVKEGGLIGPFKHPPFDGWCHVAPLMSRPKKSTEERRLISDLTFPPETSVNAYIIKNNLNGNIVEHRLPTTDCLTAHMRRLGRGAYMGSVDISRAYKNFNSDVLDLPLQCIKWDNEFYLETAMPFGARCSSLHMQRVAKAIVSILADKKVTAEMYLDDIVFISPDKATADRDMTIVTELLKELGLPEATKKRQYPAQTVVWLGVKFNAEDMTISVPREKLAEVIGTVSEINKKVHMTRKELESLIGQLIHIGRCIKPARLFISRLLAALRGLRQDIIYINDDMRADLRWFAEFATDWNGVALIPSSAPTKTVEVDACLSGIGGTDGKRAYYRQVAPIKDGAADINELEAVNAVVALHTFLDESDRGGHIKVLCDNQAAVEVFKNGRGHNHVILEAARAVWMIQAILQVEVTFVHIPGKDNVVPDNLSRAHLSDFYYARAMRDFQRHNLKFVYPEEYAFKLVFPLLRSRSGTPIAAGRRDPATEAGQGTRYQQKPQYGSPNVHRLLQVCPSRPSPPSTYGSVPLHRISGHPLPMSGHHTQHSGSHAPVPDTGGCAHRASLPPQGKTGPGWIRQNIYLCPTASAPGPTRTVQGGDSSPSAQRHRNTGARSNPDSVLRGHAQVGSVPPLNRDLRPADTPYKSRRNTPQVRSDNCHTARKERPEIQPDTDATHRQVINAPTVPMDGTRSRRSADTDTQPNRPHADVPGQEPGHGSVRSGGMVPRTRQSRCAPNVPPPPLPKEGRGGHSLQGGCHHTRSERLWGVAV